ncbi:MAG: hypothetical protein ACK4H7_02580 [Acidilobaceae archaeon]
MGVRGDVFEKMLLRAKLIMFMEWKKYTLTCRVIVNDYFSEVISQLDEFDLETVIESDRESLLAGLTRGIDEFNSYMSACGYIHDYSEERSKPGWYIMKSAIEWAFNNKDETTGVWRIFLEHEKLVEEALNTIEDLASKIEALDIDEEKWEKMDEKEKARIERIVRRALAKANEKLSGLRIKALNAITATAETIDAKICEIAKELGTDIDQILEEIETPNSTGEQ